MTRKLLWYKNDLRVHDHAVLNALSANDALLPVYCLDPILFAEHALGFPRTGTHRLRFLLESLQDLDQQLRQRGSRLIFRSGRPEELLPKLAQSWRADEVWTQREVTYEEIQCQQALRQRLNIPLQLFESRSLYHPKDIENTLKQLPDLFTHFRKSVEKKGRVRFPFHTPEKLPPVTDVDSEVLPSLSALGHEQPRPDPRSAVPFRGGESQGLNRMQDYIWQQQHLRNYKETRNGLIGSNYSSKFSLWLAHGSLSPRQVYAEVEKYEAQEVQNKSTYWLKFELLWRDFFYFVAQQYGRRIFFPEGIQGRQMHFPGTPDDFELWRRGETGQDFVDANMRELVATGYMSNRGRQNVASYLCHQLLVDWRWGAAWFESCLIDYDVCSNWGNWMYQAGVGNDARNRQFNLEKQAQLYDPDGKYRKLWEILPNRE